MLAALSSSEIGPRVLLAAAIVIIAARLVGSAIARLGQPRVQGEILAGIMLGPSLLGLAWPSAAELLFPPEVVGGLRVLAQLGLVLFMFTIGIELDLVMLRGQARKAVGISLSSILVPLVLGGALGVWLHPRLGNDVDLTGFALFLGAAMAITAFPVLARVLQETGLAGTRIGSLTIACAAVDDVTAWCLLAGVVAVVQSTGWTDTLAVAVAAIAFVAAMIGLVRPILARIGHLPVWAAVVIALVSAWITEAIGVHAIFGAFLAGAVMPRNDSEHQYLLVRLETVISDLLLPMFFVVVGLATRVDQLSSWYLWGITALVCAVAIVSKWGGSTLAARALGETWRDATVIGVLMNTRGLTEIVILTVGMEIGVIGPTMFTIMVTMALVTTFMAAPLVTLLRPEGHHPPRRFRPETASHTRS